jgi:hypothetical protein
MLLLAIFIVITPLRTHPTIAMRMLYDVRSRLHQRTVI